jgi:hypothetical protein
MRQAEFDDHEQIQKLGRRHGLEIEEYGAWRHLWVENPAFIALGGHWPIGWVLESTTHEIVGYIGNIPLQYELCGKQLLVSTSRAWVVDEAFRGYAALLLQSHFADKNVDLFLHPTVNVEAHQAYTALNAAKVPVGLWDSASFWITEYRGFIHCALSLKAIPFANAISYPLSAAARIRDTLRDNRWPRYSYADSSDFCSEIDDRFDVFWVELRKRYAHLLMAVRSSAALRWHFKYALRNGRAWILIATKHGRVVSYSIFYRNDNSALGLTRIRLVDYQSLDGTTTYIGNMLAAALSRCRREGIHLLESVGFRPYGTSLIEDNAPYRRKLPAWIYYYKTNSAELGKVLGNPTVWNPCGFDGDASL